jgi:hypothetical protein
MDKISRTFESDCGEVLTILIRRGQYGALMTQVDGAGRVMRFPMSAAEIRTYAKEWAAFAEKVE